MLAKNKVTPYADALLRAVSQDAVMVTPDVAQNALDKCQFEKQRIVRPRHLNHLASEMRNGDFLPWTQLYFCELPDGSLQLVDGYHRLNAVIQSGVTVPFTRTFYKVPTQEDVGRTYSRIDAPKIRTPMDRAKATGLDEVIPNTQTALAAMRHVLCDFALDDNKEDRTKSDTAKQAALRNDYQHASHALAPAMADGMKGYRSLVLNGPVYAVALVTTAIRPEAALEFWGAVVKNEGYGLQPKGQWKVLHDYLVNHRGSQTKYWERIRAAATAWNAYYTGKEIKGIPAKALLKATPVHILGTKFDNRPIEERGGPTRARLGPKR